MAASMHLIPVDSLPVPHVKHFVEFGRLAVVNKRNKVSGKMKEKGFAAMMVGYALNHGPETYCLYNPKTNMIKSFILIKFSAMFLALAMVQ